MILLYYYSMMTQKQKLFCLEYLKNGFNGTQAAIKAGYSKKTAGGMAIENLQKPIIKEFIQKEVEKIENAKIADIKEIFEFWTAGMRGEKFEFDSKDKIKCSELIAKAKQMFEEKKANDDQNTNTGVLVVPQRKSIDEWNKKDE